MEAKNIPVSINVLQNDFSKQRETTSQIPRLDRIPAQASSAPYVRSSKLVQCTADNVSETQRKARRVYRRLSPKSRGLSRCGSNENIRALLGYIRKKRQSEVHAEQPARRRRSFPKQSKRSSKRSRKSPRQDKRLEHVSKPKLMLSRMRVPHSV